jgi:hypothetical protein
VVRWSLFVLLAIVACARGDNSMVGNPYGFGPGGGAADDPESTDESSSDEAGTSEEGPVGPADDDAGGSESSGGAFPMPEPDDDPMPPGDSGGQPPPPPPAMGGDCCTASMGPGCANDPAVEMCVCTNDAFCCTNAWDDTCVSEVALCTDACPGAPPPPDGSDGSPCCAPTGGPGCGDPLAESCVCFFDDYCCSVDWDDQCVGIATDICMRC